MAHAALETHVATHLSLMTRLITLVELRGFEPLTPSMRTVIPRPNRAS